MSSDEITATDNPLAKFVEQTMTAQLGGLEERLLDKLGRLIEASELRIALAVEKRLERRLSQVSAAQLAFESQIHELKREVSNLKEVVFGEAFQKVLRFAEAADRDTLLPPPSGMLP